MAYLTKLKIPFLDGTSKTLLKPCTQLLILKYKKKERKRKKEKPSHCDPSELSI